MITFKPLSRTTLALAAALCLCASVQAQTKKELAAKVVQLQQVDFENIGRNVAGQTAQQVLQMAGQAMGNVPADKREAVGKEIQAEVKKFYDSIEPTLKERAGKIAATQVAPMLEEKFSEEELKQVITWLESSASKKYRELGGQLPNMVTEKVVADTRGTIEPKLKALQQSLQKKLGLPDAPASATKPAAPAKK
jgi:hypothetical protein